MPSMMCSAAPDPTWHSSHRVLDVGELQVAAPVVHQGRAWFSGWSTTFPVRRWSPNLGDCRAFRIVSNVLRAAGR